MRTGLPEHWLRATALSSLLLPASWLFAAIAAARRALYRAQVLSATRLPVPVIVVGNVMVGGTGKTPLVLALLEDLKQRGCQPGVVLRGYGAGAASIAPVHAGDDPRQAGDEAVLIAARSACPVVRGQDRGAAARQLLARHPECKVIVSDDGLQHYRLARDVEIAVEDGRGHGNGRMLPAGPLREPGDRQVDALVVNGAPHPVRVPAIGRLEHAFRMDVAPDGLYPIGEPGRAVAPSELAGRRLHAVAGIGNPERFFRTLKELGLDAAEHAFPDHHQFTADDLRFGDCDAVLMTEKDAVKCLRLADARERASWYVLRVRARLDPSFFQFIWTRLQGVRDGHPAA